MTDDRKAADTGAALAEDVDALRAALAEDGLGVDVHDQIEALVASAAEGVFWALVAAGPVGFVAEFAKLQAKSADNAVRRVLGRVAQRRQVIVSEPDGERVVEVVITPDLPEAAYRQLAVRRPPAPSGRLVWDSATSMWQDSLGHHGEGGKVP